MSRIEEIKNNYKRPEDDEYGWDYVDYDDIEYLLRIAEAAEELFNYEKNWHHAECPHRVDSGLYCECGMVGLRKALEGSGDE